MQTRSIRVFKNAAGGRGSADALLFESYSAFELPQTIIQLNLCYDIAKLFVRKTTIGCRTLSLKTKREYAPKNAPITPLRITRALTTDSRQCDGCVAAIGKQLLCSFLFFLAGGLGRSESVAKGKQNAQGTVSHNMDWVCDIIHTGANLPHDCRVCNHLRTFPACDG